MAFKLIKKLGYVFVFGVWYFLRVLLYFLLYYSIDFVHEEIYHTAELKILKDGFYEPKWDINFQVLFHIVYFSIYHLFFSYFRDGFKLSRMQISTVEYLLTASLSLPLLNERPLRVILLLAINLIVISLATLISTTAFIHFFQNLFSRKNRKKLSL